MYFKTVGLIKETKTKNNDQAKKGIIKQNNDKPVPNTFPIWKRAFNKIIFYKTVLKYAEILLALDVEIDLDELKIVQDSEDNLSFIEDKHFSTEKSFIKEKTLSSRSTPRVRSRSEKKAAKARNKAKRNNSSKKKAINNIFDKSSREKAENRINFRNNKLKEKVSNLPDLINHLNNKVQRPTIIGNEYYNQRKLNGFVIYRKDTDINDVFQIYKKKCCNDQSLKNSAIESFEKAKKFNKTWLGHVNLAVKIAKSNSLRKMNTLPPINNHKNDNYDLN